MLSRKYQNSRCKGNYLHNFMHVKNTPQGFVERCKRCGVQKHFPHNIPNSIFLSYHIRSALQAHDPLFRHEYPNAL